MIPKDLSPVLFIGGEAAVPANATTKALLTYEDRYGETVTLYRQPAEGMNWMYVPRATCDLSAITHNADGRTVNNLGAIDCKIGPRGGAESDQGICLKKTIALLKAGRDHITNAPTGWGKTYHGCAAAAALGEATLIIVTKNDLITGWHKTMLEFIGVDPNDIGHCQQKKCVFEGKRYVVAMVHSLIEREYPPEFYKHFGLVIFDEVHRLGAEYFQQVCKLFPARHRLGLSATPKRKDGRFKTFEAHIGPVMVVGEWIPMKAKILVKRSGWKVPSYPKFDSETGMSKMVQLTMTPGKLGLVLKRMAGDKVRNHQIAEFVKSAYDAGRHILILSDLIEGHLQPLFHLLAKAGVPGQDIDFYIGKRTKAQLEQAKKARVCLATYAFTSEGTDNPIWDTLVFGTPKADIKQSLGRILRFLEDKKQPVALDLIDDHGLFEGYFKSRLKQYYEYGAEIIEV